MLLLPLYQNSNYVLQAAETFENKIQMMIDKSHPAFEYSRSLIQFQRRYFHESMIKQLNPDNYKRDCSWLALQEKAYDFNGKYIGERTYYYNFMTFSKSLSKPEALEYTSKTSYLYDSKITMHRRARS